jgi:hypothetical protein
LPLSPVVLPLLLLPPNRPPSGSVIGGKVMPLLELVAPLLLPLTPLLELEEEGAEPSSPDAPDEEEGDPPPSSPPVVASSPLLQEEQPPLLVEPPPELPPTFPELLPPVPESRPRRESATLAVHPAATTPNDTTQASVNFSSNLMAEGES